MAPRIGKERNFFKNERQNSKLPWTLHRKSPSKWIGPKKSSPKNWNRLLFYLVIPFKINSGQKKLSLKIGLKNTLQDREVGNKFWKNGLLEGDFENREPPTPTSSQIFEPIKKLLTNFLYIFHNFITLFLTYLKFKEIEGPFWLPSTHPPTQ